MGYKSKQTSYDLAHEISQKAKKILGLSQYDVETLEHDINNLRAHEWLDLFDMIPDSNEVKKLYFNHCVELEDETEQELEEYMKDKETNKQDSTSKLTIDFILFTDLVFDTYQDSGDNYQAAIDRAQDIFPNIEFRKDDPDFEHITLYGNRRQIEKFLNFYKYGDNWKSRIKDNYKQELEESMNILTTVRNKLNRLCSPYQAQLWDNGRFEVHQVKEDDKDRLVNSLRRISKEVHATANGKYDFSRPAMFGNLHSQYYNIYGEIEMEDKNESMHLTEDFYGDFVQKFLNQGYTVPYIILKTTGSGYSVWKMEGTDSSFTGSSFDTWEEVTNYVQKLMKGEKIRMKPDGYNNPWKWAVTVDIQEPIYIYEIDEILKDALSTYNIEPRKAHLMDYETFRKFRELAEKNIRTLALQRHNDISWTRFKSKVLPQWNEIGILGGYDLSFYGNNSWQDVEMTYDDIKNHLKKYKNAKTYKKDKYGYPYEINKDVLLNTKFGDTTSYYGWGSGVNSSVTTVKLKKDKFNNLMVSSITMIYDSLNTHGGKQTLKESHNDQELKEDMGNKTYAVTVKYHNEPKEKIEARSAKDRKDLEYQLNMDDEVEWYDFDESQFNEGYSKQGYSWDEINGMIHIYEDGKLIDKYPDMESVEEAGWDLNELNESYSNEDENTYLLIYNDSGDDFQAYEDPTEEFKTLEDAKKRVESNYDWDYEYAQIRDFKGTVSLIYMRGEGLIDEWYDLNSMNESLDQMREKVLKMKENSNAFAILYGYRVKGKEVELEPEEFATEKDYKERIQQITNSFTKLSDKDPRGNRYGKESGIEFYTIYPNKNSNINESTMMDTLKAKYPVLDNTWTMGSDKTKLNNKEFELLYALADKLASTSPNQYKYEVKETYEDYGAGMKWYNIICYDKKGNSWQVLNTKEWLDLMNTGDVDKVYQDVVNGDYFQDKQKDIKDMNMGELFNHMED